MADTKFSQFSNGGDIQLNDILVGLRGGLNTKFNASSVINIPSKIFYFSPTGVDASGYGTIIKPTLTPNYAQTQITTASELTPFTVSGLPGKYASASGYNLKPWVSIDGEKDVVWNISNFGLDASWGTSGPAINFISNIRLTGQIINFDFNTLVAQGSLQFDNIVFDASSGVITFTASGSPTAPSQISFNNCYQISNVNVVLNDINTQLQASSFNNINITCSSSSGDQVVEMIGSSISGQLTLTASGSSTLYVYLNSTKLLNVPNCSGNVILIMDSASFIGEPILSSGADYTIIDSAFGVKADVTPINYVNADPKGSVAGALEGIDAALAGVIPTNPTAYAGFAIQNNTVATTISAQTTRFPITSDSGSPFIPIDTQDFIIEFHTISGVSTPCFRYTGTNSGVFQMGYSGALFDVSGIDEVNVYPAKYAVDTTITGLNYIATSCTLDDLDSSILSNFSASAFVSLAQGDRVFFQIQNLTNAAPPNVTIKNFSAIINRIFSANADLTDYFKISNNFSEINTDPSVALGNLGIPNGIQLCTSSSDFTLTNPPAALIAVNIPTSGHFIKLPPINVAGGTGEGQRIQILVFSTSSSVDLQDSTGAHVATLTPNLLAICENVGTTLSPVTGWLLQASGGSGASQDMQQTYNLGSEVALNDGQPIVYSAGEQTYGSPQTLVQLYSSNSSPVTVDTVYGMAFTETQDGQITELGFSDASFSSGTRQVGLWLYINNTTGTLLATATVAKTDPLDPKTGQYRMKAITPVAISNGSRYVVGALHLAGDTCQIYQMITPIPFAVLNGNNYSGLASASLVYPATINTTAAQVIYGGCNLTFQPSVGYTSTDIAQQDKSLSDAFSDFDSSAQSKRVYGRGTIAQRDALIPIDGMGWIDSTCGATYTYSASTGRWITKSLGEASYITTTLSLIPNCRHLLSSGGLATCQLPVSFQAGTIFEIVCVSGPGTACNFKITQDAAGISSSQSIAISGVGLSTVGMSGYVQSLTDFATIRIICVSADTLLVAQSLTGSVTIV